MRSTPNTAALSAGIALLLGALLALVASLGCVGTPLPDPPSARVEAITMSEVLPDRVGVMGADGAIQVGADHAGALLRLTIPRLPARVETPLRGAGAFAADLDGAITDTVYLELVDPDGDLFLVAFAQIGGVVVEVPPGADRDGDLSPDAIDCAADDPAFASLECPVACTTMADCAAGHGCRGGACVALSEACGNGIDDDGDGLIDEGCPVACRADAECAAGQVCTAGFCNPP